MRWTKWRVRAKSGTSFEREIRTRRYKTLVEVSKPCRRLVAGGKNIPDKTIQHPN